MLKEKRRKGRTKKKRKKKGSNTFKPLETVLYLHMEEALE